MAQVTREQIEQVETRLGVRHSHWGKVDPGDVIIASHEVLSGNMQSAKPLESSDPKATHESGIEPAEKPGEEGNNPPSKGRKGSR